MRLLVSALIGISSLAFTTGAQAATVIGFNGTIGTLVAGDSLFNDAGTYTSGTTPFLFAEKLGAYLFHFDSPGNNGGEVKGSFQVQLAPGETVSLLSDQLSDLNSQDTLYGVAGVTYPTGVAGRGLEGNDSFSLGALVGNLQTITYNLKGNGNNLDQKRFLVSTVNTVVPEPATWAMMLIGFGGIGLAMRRKSKARPQVNFSF